MTRKMEEYAHSGNGDMNGARAGTCKNAGTSSPAPPAGPGPQMAFAEDYREFVSLSSSLYDKLTRTLAN